MKILKPALVGLLGSLIMFIIMMFGIHGAGIAPFNVPPSAAFLIKLGLPAQPLAPILHFLYGAFWSVIFVYLFKSNPTLGKGLLLAGGLWLIMMLIISPIIGWGVFGIGGPEAYNTGHTLYLSSTPKFIISTLLLHIIYGLVIGWLNPAWALKGQQSNSSSF